jgi:hypothetical protein
MTVFMIAFASKQSFWVDELDWTIGIISGKAIFNNRLFTPMFQILLEQGYNLPLYYIIIKPLYELLPYGETFLLIPSIAFVILGIIITGKTGKLTGGARLGFVAVCIAVSSSTLIIQGGWELRPYSITFCCSALALLMYIKRLKTETNKNIFLYGVSLVLLLYCHWFGSILTLFYAFTDLCTYLRKKISLKCIFAYVLAGILFLPWFLMMLSHHTRDLSNYWMQPPKLIAPIITVSYLLSNTVLYCLLFGIGFMLILLNKVGRKQSENLSEQNIWFFMSIGIIWTILPVFIYSKFINHSGSFYVQRYFFVIMPHVFLITAYGFLETFSAMRHSFCMTVYKKNFLYSIVVVLFCLTFFQNYQKAYTNRNSVREPYREAAEYISKAGQALSANSLVICNSGSAWVEYYFSKRGFSIPANVAIYIAQSTTLHLFINNSQYIQPVLLSEKDILKYDYLYLFEVHRLFKEDFIDTIQQNYILIGERQELNQTIPKTNFVKKGIKYMLNINSSNNKKMPFGLRCYAKHT